ncbi:hypothetical protein WH87_08940 [Devosia epidermidihirudinis]|uniref:DUF1697 domain-containing protein n=1 Tax=Devosia epidermidihirudinis TaxID=1293439 RepID=A0A0F5QA18_9HYPH|nr:DUF1697 domain-containing protein [Devosia epidermidihirudinis]KKC37810.1 hypothetical protein WH87_08940 [Devosia epidermidihirudinis]
MTRYLALLRGVNLGKRQVKSADLKAAFEAMGFANVKTLLASGNVLFDADKADRAAIEAALEARFGFDIGTVLRTTDALRDLIALDPFKGRAEDSDTKLYVTFLDADAAHTLPMPCAVEGDFEVVHVTSREICILAFRMPNGRFGEGMDQIWKHFGKRVLWTSRNFNTVLKAAA